MAAKLTSIILGTILLFIGGSGLFSMLAARAPLAITLDAYLGDPPDADWFLLQDCSLNLAEASGGDGGDGGALMVPVRTAVASEENAVRGLFETSDASIAAAVGELRAIGDETAALEFSLKQADRLFFQRDLQGMIRRGDQIGESRRADLRARHPQLADDFFVVEDGAEPKPGLLAMLSLVPGIALLIFGLKGGRRAG